MNIQELDQFRSEIKGHPHEHEVLAVMLQMAILEKQRRQSRWPWVKKSYEKEIERLRAQGNKLLEDETGS